MQQKILFTKGMDSDTSPEYISSEQARKRINVRVLSSDNDQVGGIENVLGNTLISYTLPAGDNTVIGSKEDIKTKKIYFFVYNSANAHTILQYDYTNDTVTLVLQEAVSAPYYLNFDLNHLITGVTVVELNPDNHLLGWTDNYVNPNDPADFNEPKKLNIEKAILHSAGDYVNGYSSPFEPKFITRIKQPPPVAPTYTWSNTATQLINYLFKKNFQFKVQFVFDDKEVSSWSPISRYAFPATVNAGGSEEDFNEQDNTINLVIPTGSSIVTRIRVAGKQLGLTDFSLIADLSKENLNIANDTTYALTFFNDGNYVQLALEDSIALYSNVPLRAKTEAFTEGRLFWGNVTENFDPVNVDMRLPLSFELLNSPSNQFYVNKTFLKSGGIYKYGIVYYDEFGNRSGLSNIVSGKTTEYVNDRFGTTMYVPFVTDPSYSPNSMQFVPKVDVEIYNPPLAGMKRYQIVRSKNQAMDRYIQFAAQGIRYTDEENADVPPSLATRIRVNIENITGRYVVENGGSNLAYDYATGDRVRFIANPQYAFVPSNPNGPPPYVSPPAFGPNAVTSITALFAFNDSIVTGWDSSTGTFEVKIDPSNPIVPLNLYPGCIFEIYQPAEQVVNDNEITYEITEEGELIEDINGNMVHSGAANNQLIVSMSSAAYGVPLLTGIVPSSAGFNYLDKVKVVTSGYSVYGVVTSVSAIAIQVNTSGYTLVGTFDPTLTGTITRAAEFTLNSGDCFRRKCDMPYVVPFQSSVYRVYSFIETMDASNFFTSDAWDYGRPNRIDPTIKRITRESTCFWSEVFVPETDINGLSTVYIDTNFQTYDQRYGGIQVLFPEEMGMTMLQELKCSLIPIERILYGDLSLQNTVGASSSVMSPQVSYYQGEFGIGLNPESFAVYGPAKYFIDLNRGAVLRLSNDGLTVISDIGNMHNFFTDKCKAYLETNQNPKIFGVYDIKFNEYIIAFEEAIRQEPLPPISAETLAWNEKANQWSTYYSFNPEGMCQANTGIVSFSAGQAWKHNSNSTYNNFYGVQGVSEFWVYCNDNPSNVKILEAISEETDAAWEVYSITTPNGQMTNLIASDFEARENNQYAALLKDQNTPNVLNPLFEGDVMRDRVFLVKFRFTGTDYNKINAVNFQYILSNLNNR